MTPSSMTRAYRLLDGRLNVYCTSCKWESEDYPANPEAYMEDGCRIRGLSAFERGFCAGSYRHHNCVKESEE